MIGKGARAMAWLGLFWCTACAGSCEDEQTPHATSSTQTLRFEMSGCAQVPSEGVCELTDASRDLTVFVYASNVQVTADGRALPPSASEPVQGGVRLRLAVPKATRALALRTASARATITIDASKVPARMNELRALRKRGAYDALAAALDAWDAELSRSKAPDVHCHRARLLGMRARLAFSRSEPQRVDAFYSQSVPALLACGRLSEAVDDAMAQAFTRNEQLRDFSGARDALERVRARVEPYGWGAAWLSYHSAFLAMRLGDLGSALKQLDDAEKRCERLGIDDLRSITLQLRSWVLSLLNRHDQAAASIDKARAFMASAPPCERARILTNWGWQRVLAKEAGHPSGADARGPLTESVALLDTECPDRMHRAHALINLSRLAVTEGALDEAERLLQRAADDAPKGDGALQVALLDVKGRLLLDAGDARGALAVYEELSARLRAAGESLPVGALGRAKALLALNRKDRAIEALHESEDELEVQVAKVSLGMGRESLSLGRGESAALLVGTLIELGRADEALLAARRARARILWSLQREAASSAELPPEQRRAREGAIAAYVTLRQRMDAQALGAWTLPKDEIAKAERAQREQRRELSGLLEDLFPAMRVRPVPRAPKEGELIVGLFPLGGETFVFAHDAQGVRALRRPSHETPEQVLSGLSADLTMARTVFVIGPSQGLLARAHTVTFEGQPLAITKPVAYMVDLPRRSGLTQARGQLFVFDPRGDLRGARKEASWLKEQRGDTQHMTWLIGSQATRARVLSSFADAEHMHYAGHAAFDEDAWWESGLALADRSTLTVSDILAAAHVPRHVVLAACATAKVKAAGHVATMGIAQAFIAAGAEDVVATLDNIDDALAFAFTRAYHASAAGEAPDRMQRAAQALHEKGLDFGSFALFVP